MGKSCSLGGPYVLFVIWLFTILAIPCFGFEIIASVPGLCTLFIFIFSALAYKSGETYNNKPSPLFYQSAQFYFYVSVIMKAAREELCEPNIYCIILEELT